MCCICSVEGIRALSTCNFQLLWTGENVLTGTENRLSVLVGASHTMDTHGYSCTCAKITFASFLFEIIGKINSGSSQNDIGSLVESLPS